MVQSRKMKISIYRYVIYGLLAYACIAFAIKYRFVSVIPVNINEETLERHTPLSAEA